MRSRSARTISSPARTPARSSPRRASSPSPCWARTSWTRSWTSVRPRRPEGAGRPLARSARGRSERCLADGGGVLLADRREEALVDLALVDRDVLLVADADDLLPLHPELARELLGRQ